MSRLVYGVGINDADYVTSTLKTVGYEEGKLKQKRVWMCPFYRLWINMLARGYNVKYKTKYPTYKDVTVCKEWHTFSVFKAWTETQDFEGKQLDKDVLVEGNKVYSPETCVFVSSQVNGFLTASTATRGEYKIGCHWDKKNSKFFAQCSNPTTKKGEYLGLFTTEQEAHNAWIAKKLEHAYTLAALQTDERVAKALIERFTNYN